MGLEGEDSQYTKLRGVNTHELVRELQSHGIKILGSTIIGMEDHTPENIDQVIDYAVRHDTDFHQFMLYTPIEGTPLHAEMLEQGRMKPKSEFHPGDIHGQFMFNYHHPHIHGGLETELMVRAFRRDLEVNGPSVVRVARTTLAGWKRHRQHPDRGFEVVLPAKFGRWLRPTHRSCGRPGDTIATHRSCTPKCRNYSGISMTSSAGRLESPRRLVVLMSSGKYDRKNDDWPAGGRTNLPPSTRRTASPPQ